MAQKRLDRKLDMAAGAVTFTNLENSETLTVSIDEVFGKGTWDALGKAENGEMNQHNSLHGVNSWGGDAAADKNKGDPLALIATRVKSIQEGNWSVRGEGGGGTRITILAEAISAYYKNTKGKEVSPADVAASLAELKTASEAGDEKAKAKLEGLKAHKGVDAEKQRITAKRAADKAKAAQKASAESPEDLDLAI